MLVNGPFANRRLLLMVLEKTREVLVAFPKVSYNSVAVYIYIYIWAPLYHFIALGFMYVPKLPRALGI